MACSPSILCLHSVCTQNSSIQFSQKTKAGDRLHRANTIIFWTVVEHSSAAASHVACYHHTPNANSFIARSQYFAVLSFFFISITTTLDRQMKLSMRDVFRVAFGFFGFCFATIALRTYIFRNECKMQFHHGVGTLAGRMEWKRVAVCVDWRDGGILPICWKWN